MNSSIEKTMKSTIVKHPTYHIVFHTLPLLSFFFKIIFIFHKIYLFTSNAYIILRISKTNWLRNHYTQANYYFLQLVIDFTLTQFGWFTKFFIFSHCFHQQMHEFASKAAGALTTCFTQLSLTEDESIRENLKTFLLLRFYLFFFLTQNYCLLFGTVDRVFQEKFKLKEINQTRRLISICLLMFCDVCYCFLFVTDAYVI